ncbi:MAG: HEPN domain-containing protein [Candidatus ainarchaeum sp.]|nr:HEPN domain-containing protein [Candidatus ainarchaeum sp.]
MGTDNNRSEFARWLKQAKFDLHGKREVLTHSVYELVGLAGRLDKSANGLAQAKRLDHFYISTRYPGSIPADSPHEFFTPEDAQECIRHASTVIAWVEKKGAF